MCQTLSECKRILQFTLVELENKTKLTDQLSRDKSELTAERNQLVKDRDDWKNLYLDERKASQQLAAANLSQQTAINEFQKQRKLDEDMIGAQKRKIRWLKVEKYLYSGGSFAAGFGTGYLVANRKQVTNFFTQQTENIGGLNFRF